MSVYIKDMKMPKNCKECPFYWEQCGVDPEAVEEGYRTEGERHPDCPLIPVPNHGRLKDYDQIMKEYNEWFSKAESREYESMFYALYRAISDSRTIIPGR